MSIAANHKVQEQAQAIATHCGRPLLVLYWSDDGGVEEHDVGDLRRFLKAQGLTRARVLSRLDVLIETNGGESEPPYLIGQMLHDYAEIIYFWFPTKRGAQGLRFAWLGTKWFWAKTHYYHL